MDGVQNSRIENNLVYDNHASGISLYSDDGGGRLHRQRRRQQHRAPSRADGRWALNIRDGSTGNTVLNNILVSEHSFRGSIAMSEDSLGGW